MQNPNENTEWNDQLRSRGIIPPKQEKEISEEAVVNILEETVNEKLSNTSKKLEDFSLDELDLVEDEEDEKVLQEYRQKRLAEMKLEAMKSKFGDVREISAEDYVAQVNKAGEGVWVILHLYKPGIPLCSIINNYLTQLATKFPSVKFLKSVSDTCIPNFPDRNLPSIFIYLNGMMVKQFIGADNVGGMSVTIDELEWKLSETGAVKTDLESNPKKKIKDVLMSQLIDDDKDNDW